jgi:NAD-dependent SIR2 family protein deacetylase/DNA-binding SARP family transcriptional activator
MPSDACLGLGWLVVLLPSSRARDRQQDGCRGARVVKPGRRARGGDPARIRRDAERHERAGRLQEAASLYAELLRHQATSADVENRLGDIVDRLGQTRQALVHWANAATAYEKDGFFARAIAALGKVVRRDPAAVDARMQLARLYARQGQVPEAKSHYRTLVEEATRQRNRRGAIAALEGILVVDPDDMEARLHVVPLYREAQQTATATAVCVTAVDQLRRAGRLKEAGPFVAMGLQMEPGSARLRQARAEMQLADGRADLAVPVLEELRLAAPDDEQLAAALGEAYLAQGRTSAAEALFRALPQQGPDAEGRALRVVEALLREGEASRAYERLLPLVETALAAGDAAGAVALVERFLARQPAHSPALSKLASIHHARGAIPALISTYARLADAHINEGRAELARGVLEVLASLAAATFPEAVPADRRSEQADVEDAERRAAEEIRSATALVITAGTGMGVDSGLPDYRDAPSFASAYPAYRELGLQFEDLAEPSWFTKDPALAWGFYGSRLEAVRSAPLHDGFATLAKWARSAADGAFVVTTSVDGLFHRAGFEEGRTVQCYGSLDWLQCTRSCGVGLFSSARTRVSVDAATLRAREPFPPCPSCGALARPNILMFGDFDWDTSRLAEQEDRFRAWLETVAKRRGRRVVIVECGDSVSLSPTRLTAVKLMAALDARLVRLNRLDAGVPEGGIGITLELAEAFRRLAAGV